MDTETIRLTTQMLIADEGLSLLPYEDTAGFLTIGYGHNLDAKGITGDIALKLLEWDISECLDDLRGIGYWNDLSSCRQSVLINLRFNLGWNGFKNFKRMHEALVAQDYDAAADEIIDSEAYRTNSGLERRYGDLAKMMRTDVAL